MPRINLLVLHVMAIFFLLMVSSTLAQIGQSGEVFGLFVEWSPDGRYIAITENENIVILSSELERIATLQAARISDDATRLDLFTLNWSPDSQFLGVSVFDVPPDGDAQSYIIVWESTTWSEFQRLDGITNNIAWSPDSQFLAVGVQTIDVSTGTLVASLTTPSSVSRDVVWSPTDDVLVVYNTRFTFYNPLTYQPLTPDFFPTGLGFKPSFSPDGRLLAVLSGNESYSSVIDIIDVSTFQLLRTIPLPSEPIGLTPFTWLSNNELAYSRLLPNGASETFIIDPTNDAAQILFQEEVPVLNWSPGGAYYLRFKGSFQDDTRVLSKVERATGDTTAQIAIGDYQATNHFELYDSAAASTIAPLSIGETIDVGVLPPNAVINAKMSPETVGSVIFDLNGTQTIVNTEPYTIPIPPAGTYSLTATPYTEADGGGSAGAPLTIEFTVSEP